MTHECPTCGAEFDSSRGLKVHHSRGHGTTLPNRTCEYCGVDFYSEHERKYCSVDCRSEGVSYCGSSNPNYRDAKEETSCDICGESFEYYPSEKEGRYCTSCVTDQSWRSPPTLHKEENPRWNGGKTERPCTVCGSTVRRYPSEFSDSAVLCSETCRSHWLSKTFSGEDHPNWRGGPTGPYGPGWARVRRRALERDGYQCVVCHTSKSMIGRNPDVHHLVPVRDFVMAEMKTKSEAHRLENVVTLCPSCHRKADNRQLRETTLRDRRDTQLSTDLTAEEIFAGSPSEGPYYAQ